jgi:hypothetical protein
LPGGAPDASAIGLDAKKRFKIDMQKNEIARVVDCFYQPAELFWPTMRHDEVSKASL